MDGPVESSWWLHMLISTQRSQLLHPHATVPPLLFNACQIGPLKREFRMTGKKKQKGNGVLWFPGPYSQLSVGNFLPACPLQRCLLVKYRFFRALFIHKIQFVPHFWCLNVDIWRSQSAIWCSLCIFNIRRDMRAGETVAPSFIPQNFPW